MTKVLQRPLVIGGILALAVAIPFIVTAIALAHPNPFVVLDLAQTEMRVRAVFSLHPPLIGLPGRIGHYLVHTGSHPGPASFFALAPGYKLFGSTPWALFASALSVNFTWILVALWIGYRRMGRAGLLGIGVGVMLLVHTFGMYAIEQPWNPYLPLMAWTVVLLAAWSVLLDDAPMLPVLAVSATYCMQIHLPYLGLAGGVVGATVAYALVSTWMRSRRAATTEDEAATGDGDEDAADRLDDGSAAAVGRYREGVPDLGRLLRWGGFAAVLALLLWFPPIWEQFRAPEGNFSLIWGDLAHPPEAAGGLGQGIRLMFRHLNPPEMLRGHATRYIEVASAIPGYIVFPIWLGSVLVAWRGRMRRILHLHLVLAFGLVFGVISLSKIYGDLYWYLMMWAWTLGVLMVGLILWTALEWFRARASARAERGGLVRLNRSVTGVAMGCVALLFVAITVDAANAKIPNLPLSNQMNVVVPEMVAAIRAGETPSDRKTGMFVVTWNDPVNIGSPGYTVLDELQRRGIRSGLLPMFRGIVTDNELVFPGTERGIVHVAVGKADIDAWRAKPTAREVAYEDGRTKAQIAEFARLRTETIRILKAHGDDPSIVDASLVGGSLMMKLPQSARTNMSIMGDIGLPIAIFLAAPGTK
jgi:hypothetical protein